MHSCDMKDATNDNDTWQTLSLATRRLLQRYEDQNERGEGDTDARRTDEKDSSNNGSEVDQRRAATG
jgi:hypothetical protein